MTPRKTLASILLCSGLIAHAAGPGDLAITVQGVGPYYKITLPVPAYGVSKGNDLSDLRVRNAAGQAIPFAWVRSDTAVHATKTQPVRIYPMPPATAKYPEVDPQVFAINENGTLQPVRKEAFNGEPANSWLIEVSPIRGRLLQAHFEIPADKFGLFPFRLEASDDLKRWRPVGGDEQLLRLQHQTQTLERMAIDLGGIQTHFLRLRWLHPQHATNLSKVVIDSVDDIEPLPIQQWTEALAPAQCGDDYCDYNVPSGAPTNSLKVQLGQTNTLATVQVYGMTDADTVQPRPAYRSHNPLYALRHQHRLPAPDVSSREVILTDGVVYRLSKPEGEANSDALQLDGRAWKVLRLRTIGPITSLGSVPPRVSLSVPLKTLVFLGQGERPYSVGPTDSADAKQFAVGAPIAISTLVPNYKPELLADMEQGNVAVPTMTTSPAKAASTPPAQTPPNRRVWLWAALVAGLLLLAGMAWSLLNGLKKSQAQVGPPEA